MRIFYQDERGYNTILEVAEVFANEAEYITYSNDDPYDDDRHITDRVTKYHVEATTMKGNTMRIIESNIATKKEANEIVERLYRTGVYVKEG